MPITPPETGIRSPFRFRVGIDFDTWRGLNKESDPGSIQDSQLQDAINIRILPNGAIVNRFGQSKLNSVAMDACISGIFDDEVAASKAKWYFGLGDGTGSTGNVIQSLDPSNDVLAAVTDGGSSTGGSWTAAVTFNGDLIALVEPGDGGVQLRKVAPGTAQTTLVHDFGLSTLSPETMVVVGSLLYIAVRKSNNDLRIYTWDGATAILDHTFASPGGTLGGTMGAYNGEPYVAANSVIYQRAAGTWTALAMPVGIGTFHCFDMAVFNNKLYIAGANGSPTTAAAILSYDGATLATARSIGNSASDHFASGPLAVFGSVLCYVWFDSTGNAVKIGTFDGATWTDTAHDFGSTYSLPRLVLNQTPSNLYLVTLSPASVTAEKIVKSPSGTVVGTWTDLGYITGRVFSGTSYTYAFNRGLV